MLANGTLGGEAGEELNKAGTQRRTASHVARAFRPPDLPGQGWRRRALWSFRLDSDFAYGTSVPAV